MFYIIEHDTSHYLSSNGNIFYIIRKENSDSFCVLKNENIKYLL